MTASTDSTRAKIADEFATAMSEAQDMLQRAASESGDRARDLRSQVETKLLHAKLRLQELEGDALERAKTAARATDDYVHDHPWRAIGAAAVVGFVVGLLMNRR
jgi:ElaB/YqjD/DUF883 family membrane-anchored ribosome-binding protein